jgi:hypothetical protein
MIARASLGLLPLLLLAACDGAEDTAPTSGCRTFGVDGAPDGRFVFSVDEDGDLTSVAYDDRVDGVVDGRYGYRFDADGAVIDAGYDDGADGSEDATMTMLRTPDGGVVGEAWDRDADGEVDHEWRYVFDVDGRLLREELVMADDTLVGVGACAEGPDGHPVPLSWDVGGDGDLETRYEVTEESGRVTRLVGTRGDSGDDVIVTLDYSYDADGRLESVSWDLCQDVGPLPGDPIRVPCPNVQGPGGPQGWR